MLQGTQVRLRITPTMKAPTGRIVLDGGNALPLAPEGDVFTGTIPVTKDGFYRVELQGGPENKLVNASPHTRSTSSKIRRRPSRLRSRDATPRPRRSKSSRSKRVPTMTSACGSSSSSIR